MQKAKTFVSQRISTTHKVLIWRPSRKKKTHGHNVAPKHARSRTVGGCSARIRLTGLVSAWQRWCCCRPLARWASGQRHFLEVTVLGGILVVGDIRCVKKPPLKVHSRSSRHSDDLHAFVPTGCLLVFLVVWCLRVSGGADPVLANLHTDLPTVCRACQLPDADLHPSVADRVQAMRRPHVEAPDEE